jgi:hypothetical protein
MTIKHLYPPAWPKVDFNFAATRQLDPRITFTRDSIGTYIDAQRIIRYAAENEPRFDHDGATGESLGLLIEEFRTNAIKFSTAPDAEFVQDSANFTYTFNQPAPDGTNTAHLIENTSNTGSNGGGYMRENYTIPTTGYIAVSVFVKPVGPQQIFLGGDPSNQGYYGVPLVSYDFTVSPPEAKTTGNNGQFGFTAEPYIQEIGNGWYRLIEIVNLTNGEAFLNGVTKGPRVCNVTPGTSTYVWGFQCEVGAFATSYIPTSGATEDRSQDVAQINPASPYLYGTFLAKYKNQAPDNFGRNIFSVGSSNAYGAFVCTADGRIVLPGLSELAETTNIENPNSLNTVATRRIVGDYAVCLNGGPVATTSNTNDRLTNSVITFMFGEVGNDKSGGHISRFSYYPRGLSDEQLQALTS